MAKVDDILAERQAEVSTKLAQLQEARNHLALRLSRVDAEIASLTTKAADVVTATVEVDDLKKSK